MTLACLNTYMTTIAFSSSRLSDVVCQFLIVNNPEIFDQALVSLLSGQPSLVEPKPCKTRDCTSCAKDKSQQPTKHPRQPLQDGGACPWDKDLCHGLLYVPGFSGPVNSLPTTVQPVIGQECSKDKMQTELDDLSFQPTYYLENK